MFYRICLVLSLVIFLFVFWKYVFGAWVLQKLGWQAQTQVAAIQPIASLLPAPIVSPETNMQGAAASVPISPNGPTQLPDLGVSIQIPTGWKLQRSQAGQVVIFDLPAGRFVILQVCGPAVSQRMATAQQSASGISDALASMNEDLIRIQQQVTNQQASTFHGYPAFTIDYTQSTSTGRTMYGRRIVFYANPKVYILETCSILGLPSDDSGIQAIVDSLVVNPSSP